ncbi:membrane protein insertion efficiency factor YidD [Neotabrizicola sp. sgz301269]|uniref:membrane protein insertion efficiency factor YidD n=1 Tax=Neotabrizicola sp. sgz301269 TaxID=3276282 RepID=UPI003770601B
MLSRLALAAIHGDQRHLSPREGYGCAYRLAHGGTGCSGFAKVQISEHGLFRALPPICARFAACRDTAEELLARRRAGEKESEDRGMKRRERWWDKCDCGPCDCFPSTRRGGQDLTPDCDCTPDCCSL